MREKAQNGYNSRSPQKAQTVLCTYPTTDDNTMYHTSCIKYP